MTPRRTAVASIALTIFLLPVALLAEQPKPAPPAPVPAQILAAKKIFIANAGGENHFYDDPIFSGTSNRAYDEFFADTKTWGRYELVGSPADADLIFELQFTLPFAPPNVYKGTIAGPAPFDPQFRLVIRDPKTNVVLWGFTEHVQWAVLQGNRDKNFEQALNRVEGQLQALSVSPSADEAKK